MASSSWMEATHRRLTVVEYLTGEETNRPQELAYGVLREPPAPTFEHQMIVGAVYERLNRHVQGNHRHDRFVKAKWYREYGVREYWLVDLIACQLEVRDLTCGETTGRVFERGQLARSGVLPRLRLKVRDLFDARSSG